MAQRCELSQVPSIRLEPASLEEEKAVASLSSQVLFVARNCKSSPLYESWSTRPMKLALLSIVLSELKREKVSVEEILGDHVLERITSID